MIEHEEEIKLGLPDERAWRWVRDAMRSPRIEIQRNAFFDRPDGALEGHRVGVRLRRTADRLRLALKGPETQPAASGISRRVELERDLDPPSLDAALRDGLDLRPALAEWRDDAESAVPPARSALALLDLVAPLVESPLPSIGGFENERTRGALVFDASRDPSLPERLPVELDRTFFTPDRVDYELEVEARPGIAIAALREPLTRWLSEAGGIETIPSTSKLARFRALARLD